MSLQLPDDAVALLWGELQTEINNASEDPDSAAACIGGDFEAAVQNIGITSNEDDGSSAGENGVALAEQQQQQQQQQRLNSMPTLFEEQELNIEPCDLLQYNNNNSAHHQQQEQSLLAVMSSGASQDTMAGSSSTTMDHRRYLYSDENTNNNHAHVAPVVEKHHGGSDIISGSHHFDNNNMEANMDLNLNNHHNPSSVVVSNNDVFNLQQYANDVSKRFSAESSSFGLKNEHDDNGGFDPSLLLFEPTPVLDPDPCGTGGRSPSMLLNSNSRNQLQFGYGKFRVCFYGHFCFCIVIHLFFFALHR